MHSGVIKVISGGQTGADRGALRAAQQLGITTGGFMPSGFRAEDGEHPEFAALYGMAATSSASYLQRTSMNVEYAQGTLIFGNPFSPGCKLTRRCCERANKPFCTIIWPTSQPFSHYEFFRQWLSLRGIHILNVAGNREEKNPGIGDAVAEFLIATL